MPTPLQLHPDRLLPVSPELRSIARRLYQQVADLPIISPHGHTDAAWFATNEAFADAAELLIKPDHYVFRMLYSLGVPLAELGLPGTGIAAETDNRQVWRRFAGLYHAFCGTPSRTWLDHVFAEVFKLEHALDESTADQYYDHINEHLATDEFQPRALFERFNIELLATTESPLDSLQHHRALRDSDWQGRVITTYRPDGRSPQCRCAKAVCRGTRGQPVGGQAEIFRGQMLTEMAAMSVEDGLVMQLHPGSSRKHNPWLFQHYGRDKGADIPMATEYVKALKPLLNRFGNEPNFTLILFTLDETAYSRELAPLAGHYPCLKLEPAWWFHDSPEGMRRYRQQVTETAGFYNTVGFNDDTRAFLSIPARHDVARRMDAGYLAELVADHRLSEEEAAELALDLSYRLAKTAYRLDMTRRGA